jgi:deoxycytidylate deaminase
MESAIGTGECAKVKVKCTLVTTTGAHIIGGNWCANPQENCPRGSLDGYEKCQTICGQYGHAEEVAVLLAGENADGATAYLEGHTYYCMNCQHVLFKAGVKNLCIGKPIS